MPDQNQLEILIKIKEDLEGLRRTQDELKNAKAQTGSLGTSFEKTAVSGRNLQRANVALSSVMSGNLVGAIGAVRGALASMLGWIGLVIAAITMIVQGLCNLWQANKAAEAARAADEFAYAMNRSKESADDLAKASVEAFAAAITKSRQFYDETNAALERQFASMDRIARAKLALEQTKIRTDPSLTAEQKIIAEQKLINDHEATTLQQKGELLAKQKQLAEQAKVIADHERDAAQIAYDAAKAKPREAWIDQSEIDKLQALKTEIENKLEANRFTGLMSGGAALESGVGTLSKKDQAALDKETDDLKAQLESVDLRLKKETETATIEERRSREVSSRGDMLKTASTNAEQIDANLQKVNERQEEFKNTELQVAAIEKNTRDVRASGEVSDTRLKTEKQIADEANRIKDTKEKTRLDEIHFDIEQANKDPRISEQEKQTIINGLIQKEHDLLGEMIERRKTLLALETDPLKKAQIEAEIQALNLKNKGLDTPRQTPKSEKSDIENARDYYNSKHNDKQLTAGQGVEAGIYDAANQLGGVGDQLEQLFSGTIMDSVKAIGDGIYGWVTGTQSFGDALRSLGDSIFKEMLNTIIRMGAQWLINFVLIKTGIISTAAVQDTTRQTQTQKTIQAQGATLPGATANAAATGISSLGTALVFGALAIALILAATGAFESGGPIHGGEQFIRVNEKGPEYVVNAGARAKYGDSLLSQINAGTFDPNAGMNALAATPAASASTPAAALAQAAGNAPARGGQSAASAIADAVASRSGNSKSPVNVYPFFDRAALTSHILTSGEFDARVVEIMDNNKYRYS